MLLQEPVKTSVIFTARLPLPLDRFPAAYWRGSVIKERFIRFEVKAIRRDGSAILARPLNVSHGLSMFSMERGKLRWVTYNIEEQDLGPTVLGSFVENDKLARTIFDGREFEVA